MDMLYKENNIFYNIICFLISENEKLFFKSDCKLYWKSITHILVLIKYCYIGLYATTFQIKDHPLKEVRVLDTWWAKAGILTGWNIMFQSIFLCLAFYSDFLEWTDRDKTALAKKIAYWRDVIFESMVVPFTMFVTTMFWGVYWIDRELVFPEVFDKVVPWWFNHCVHTNIAVIVLVETILHPRRRPVDFSLEIKIMSTITMSYTVVYYSIYFLTDTWLYKVFGVMTWWQVCLYQLLIWGMGYFYFFVQYPFSRLIHGSDDPSEEKPIQPIDVPQEKENEVDEKKSNMQIPPLGTEWNMKYRNIRNQFENTAL